MPPEISPDFLQDLYRIMNSRWRRSGERLDPVEVCNAISYFGSVKRAAASIPNIPQLFEVEEYPTAKNLILLGSGDG